MPPFPLVDLAKGRGRERDWNLSHTVDNNFVNYGLLISRLTAMCIN